MKQTDMESTMLYRAKKDDIPRLQELLTCCFAKDQLYEALIPDEDTRNRLLPELMKCDVEEFFRNCEIYADSIQINGALVVSDESEPYNPLLYMFEQMVANLKTDGYLIKEDPSLKTLGNFFVGRDYLNESWADQLHQNERIHIIYLAVDPKKQHQGIADLLMNEVINYAAEHKLMLSLETHNPDNVDMYKHYGFKLFGVMERHFGLKQYCLVKEV